MATDNSRLVVLATTAPAGVQIVQSFGEKAADESDDFTLDITAWLTTKTGVDSIRAGSVIVGSWPADMAIPAVSNTQRTITARIGAAASAPGTYSVIFRCSSLNGRSFERTILLPVDAPEPIGGTAEGQFASLNYSLPKNSQYLILLMV